MEISGNLDLHAVHRAAILSLLQEHLPGVTVWAYGSRVQETSRRYSDLDLVVFSKPEQEPQIADLRAAFGESDLPFRVDLFVWEEVSDSFRERIEAEHVVFAEDTGCDRWLTVPLGDLVSNFDSRRIPLSSRARSAMPGRYPYYGATGIMDYVDDYLFEGLHLLVAEDGSVETPRGTPVVQLVDGQFWVNNHAHVVRGSTDAETRYLYYALSTVPIRQFVSGSVQAKVSQRNLNQIPIPHPRSESQRRAIARVLGTLDDRIQMSRRMNETLEAVARALFKSWFVDFDPVRAKMEGRDSELPQEIADLFPDRLVESELGETPEGWQTFRLEDLAEHHKETSNPVVHGEKEVEHFSIPAFDVHQVPVVESGRSIRSIKTVVPCGAVLLSKLNPETARVWWPHDPGGRPQLCSTEFLAYSPRPPANRCLLYALFRSAGFRTLLAGMVTGTSKSHQRVQPRALSGTSVLTGTPALFDRYGRAISPLLQECAGARLRMVKLAALRDTLLPKLVSGEVRLPPALVERYGANSATAAT